MLTSYLYFERTWKYRYFAPVLNKLNSVILYRVQVSSAFIFSMYIIIHYRRVSKDKHAMN